MMDWLFSQNPAWMFMIFPLMFVWGIICMLNIDRKLAKKRAMPHTMTNREYEQHNQKRFSK
jgi:hypothetical protein